MTIVTLCVYKTEAPNVSLPMTTMTLCVLENQRPKCPFSYGHSDDSVWVKNQIPKCLSPYGHSKYVCFKNQNTKCLSIYGPAKMTLCVQKPKGDVAQWLG